MRREFLGRCLGRVLFYVYRKSHDRYPRRLYNGDEEGVGGRRGGIGGVGGGGGAER